MREKKRQIFICYRRDDSAYAATAIYDKLRQELEGAEVFFDVQTIPPGRDFRAFLHDAVARCDVLLVVIGINWVDLRFEEGPSKGRRRLSDTNDYVRIEIASALNLGIPVIPVLVGGAEMPNEEFLPSDLHQLVSKQATEVRAGRDFVRHVGDLVAAIKTAWEQRGSEQSEGPPPKVFLNYSHRDAAVADTIAETLRAVGFAPLQDLKGLRAGESWGDQVQRLIEEADLFVLLWSTNLRNSPYAEKEWRFALSLDRERFIRPVYFEEPFPHPPRELMHLHFSRISGLTPSGQQQ